MLSQLWLFCLILSVASSHKPDQLHDHDHSDHDHGQKDHLLDRIVSKKFPESVNKHSHSGDNEVGDQDSTKPNPSISQDDFVKKEEVTGDCRAYEGDVWVGGFSAILVFYLVILFVGAWAGWTRRGREVNQEQVMLAGRDLGLFVGVLTMGATWVGGGFINGSAQ